jgi:cupredoxin-like protein
MKIKSLSAITFVATAALVTSSFAQAPIEVHLKNHRFTPNMIKVKANQTAVIMLFNDDDTADEFDSSSLKVEKVVPGHAKGAVRLRPLPPGKYPFMGEFHAATAQGTVIAE